LTFFLFNHLYFILVLAEKFVLAYAAEEGKSVEILGEELEALVFCYVNIWFSYFL